MADVLKFPPIGGDEPLRQALTRSVAEECGGPRAVPYSPVSFEAFQVGENGRTYPIEGIIASTVDNAIVQAITLRAFSHKQHMLIRESDGRKQTVHLFAIKRRSAPRYVYRDHETHRVNDLYAAPVCSFDAGILA